ncbi:T9SS type A sorting domain-containing protein [Hymenobacter sp. H14-R3]|uniref:T9SS type A sorting domain-containing protein n=1 Tax=Hymenobacter sp. H14-R3 TaxID=3046308 RepID=UPI0024BAC689|nr:T9SS type A sorting domain-containing protein [Hymenobacter sp. H14-R3]MDJ0368011.1 T9SS type A sorting domain-containing protein [Hymenobacter sp. H14-R3]
MLLLLFLSIVAKQSAWAQHEADTWYFGDRTGFSFRGGAAQPLLDGQLRTGAACAVASDGATGQLLFYTNAEQVWNREHRLMPGGSGLQGSQLVTQGALIVPVPGSATKYYLFTLLQQSQPGPFSLVGGRCQLVCSLVDMQLGGGLGDLEATSKNVPLAQGLTQKLTAIRHTNGRDYWVVVHQWGSAAFLVYPITAQGVGTPRRQLIGPTHPAQLADTLQIRGTDGQLQASPDGRKLACAVSDGIQPFSVFDFDAAQGTLSAYANLGALRDGYGVSFSPDNTKLYVQNFSRAAQGTGYNVISQYDMSAGDPAAIAASGSSLIVDNPATNIRIQQGGSYYTLQNGPDGHLYGASWYRGGDVPAEDSGLQTFYVIAQPNARGFASAIRAERYEFAGRTAGPSMPNFMQHYFNNLAPALPIACDPATVALFPNPATGSFQVRLPGNCTQEYSLILYNSVGQQVLQANGITSDGKMSVDHLATGLYLATLKIGQQIVTKKLIIY